MLLKLLTLLTLVFTGASIKRSTPVYAATGTVTEKTIYIDLSSNEELKGNTPYLKYTKDNKATNVALVADADDVYHTETAIPLEVLNKESNSFEIRCSTSFKSEQISNSSLKNGNYNYLLMSETSDVDGYGWYGPRTSEKLGATYKTQRIWLNNAENSKINLIGYEYNNTFVITDFLSITNSYNNTEYHYVDIPFTVSTIHFMDMSEYIINTDYSISLSYGVCYMLTNSNINPTIVDGANSSILSLVVESYLTYGKNDSNGCTESTVKNLFDTWFKNKSATSDDLKNAKIQDYTGYAANGNSYEGLEKNASFSINEKWNTMCSQVGIDPKTGQKRKIGFNFLSSDLAKFAVVVGGTFVVFTLLYFVLRYLKKKFAKE